MFVRREIALGQLLGDHGADLLAVGAAADLGHQHGHDLAHVARRGRATLVDGLADQSRRARPRRAARAGRPR